MEEAGTGRERSAATPAAGGAEGQGGAERKWEPETRPPLWGSGAQSKGGKAALRPAGRLLPAGTRSAAAASPGGGGDNQAAAAVGRRRRRRASGPGVRNHSRPRRSGARGSRLPVKNVSHQRRPGTARGAGGAAARSLPFPLPGPVVTLGGGGRRQGGHLHLASPPGRRGSRPPPSLPAAMGSGCPSQPGWRASFPARPPLFITADPRRSAPPPRPPAVPAALSPERCRPGPRPRPLCV